MQIYDPEEQQADGSGPVRLLKNPLPEPPRRSHIRMEFDITDPENNAFDIEISGEDDFDI